MPRAHLKSAGMLVAIPLLAGVALLCHRQSGLAWHTLGSLSAIIALGLLWTLAARHYPFARGSATVRGRTFELGPLLRELWPALLVVGVAVGLLAPLLRGQMPLSHDHAVHLYKAWHFWEEMLLEGRLRGWSSYWFFGYPAEELYPIGSDLWVALFRAGTLGLLSWETTYGLSFVGVFAFAAYAVYAFGRHHFGRLAGVAAALFWLLDMGDYREGGWSYTVDWAVWVQILAMGFFLLLLKRLHLVLERGSARDYALGGLIAGAALLSHQMNVMLLGIALPLLLLARWLSRPGKRLGPEVARAAAVLGLGGLIAAFWLLPMLSRSGWTVNIGDLWRDFSVTARGMVDGTVLAHNWPYVVFLGLLGAAVGVAMRRATAIYLLLTAAVLLVISTSTAFDELRLMLIAKAFAKIQYQRLLIPAKACLYLLAGFGLAQLVLRVQAFRQARDQRLAAKAAEGAPSEERGEDRDAATPAAPALEGWRRLALLALIALLLAPFARPMLLHLHQSYLRTLGSLVLPRSVSYWDDYQAFLRWSAAEQQRSEPFYRISYELERHNHMLMGAPVHNKTPYYKVGYTPAKLFKHVTETTEDALYRALSVRYVVSLGPLSRPGFSHERSFGALWVYRFDGYRPQRYTVKGKAQVKVERFDEEQIRLRLSGVAPGSTLKVHVANYPRWRAQLGGETLPISEVPAYGTAYPMLMEVPIRDGLLQFDYVMRGPDWLGALCTLLGLGTVALLLLRRRRPALAQWLDARVVPRLLPVARWSERLAGPAVALAVLGVAGFVTYRVARGTEATLSQDSLSTRLEQARVTMAGKACDRWAQTRTGMGWFCSDRSWNYVGLTTNKFNGAFLPCIWAHPVDDGPLTVRFPGVTLGRAVVGNHGLADGAVDGFPQGAPVTLTIAVDGKEVASIVRTNTKGWIGFRADTSAYQGKTAELSFSISTPNSGVRHYCFDARIDK